MQTDETITEAQTLTEEIDKLTGLPFIIGDVGIEFNELDGVNHRMTIQLTLFNNEEDQQYPYKMTIDLDTMEKVSEEDPYGLLDMADSF